eukprot:7338296-Pyramimonas_sp.AAC.1
MYPPGWGYHGVLFGFCGAHPDPYIGVRSAVGGAHKGVEEGGVLDGGCFLEGAGLTSIDEARAF